MARALEQQMSVFDVRFTWLEFAVNNSTVAEAEAEVPRGTGHQDAGGIAPRDVGRRGRACACSTAPGTHLRATSSSATSYNRVGRFSSAPWPLKPTEG